MIGLLARWARASFRGAKSSRAWSDFQKTATQCRPRRLALGGGAMWASQDSDQKGVDLGLAGGQEDIEYCRGLKDQGGTTGNKDNWQLFVERPGIWVWRREHEHLPGLYRYKLYGHFQDVTVWEFLAVQLDLTKFRLSWDSNTVDCRQVAEEDQGLVYYWQVAWPTFFSNRDYCCLRRHQATRQGEAVVSTKATSHPACPKPRGTWRVEDYCSFMAIRATNGADHPGVEFSLTMFEDPGCQLPESITSWVAMRALPDFITNMRLACLKLRTVGDKESIDIPRPLELRRLAEEADMRATKDGPPLAEESLMSSSPDQSTKHIEDHIVEQESLSHSVSLDTAAKDSYRATEDSSTLAEESFIADQTGVDSSMHSRPSTPENADSNDEGKPKEETSDSNLEEEKCSLTTSKNTLISSPVVSPMRENISSLSFREAELELVVYEEKCIARDTVLMEKRLTELGGLEEGHGVLGSKHQVGEEVIQQWLALVQRKSRVFHRRLLLDLLAAEEDLQLRQLQLGHELRQLDEMVGAAGGYGAEKEALLLAELADVVQAREALEAKREEEQARLEQEEEKQLPGAPYNRAGGRRSCKTQ